MSISVPKQLAPSTRGGVTRPVVTRFLPEPSGYLHIGHLRAILLSQAVANKYEGRMRIRFDDTNPETEEGVFEDAILEDLQTLGINVDSTPVTHTSDYFDDLIDHCTDLIQRGLAYVDLSTGDQITTQRANLRPSPSRDQTVDQNMELWNKMLSAPTSTVVRLKMDYRSPNGNLRDPVAYRHVAAPHHRTKDAYYVYPSYDFACPIVDYMEGVTHVLRGIEYVDRKDQYKWVLKMVGFHTPSIFCFGRIRFTGTDLSKRKIKQLVNDNTMHGFDDPRLPTIRGVLSQGMSIDALKNYFLGQGFSTRSIETGWGKIWAVNRKIIDKKAVRMMAVPRDSHQVCYIKTPTRGKPTEPTEIELTSIPVSGVNPSLGIRELTVSPSILVNCYDMEQIKNGDGVIVIHIGGAKYNRLGSDKSLHHQFTINDDHNFGKKDYRICWVPVARHVEVTVDTVDRMEINQSHLLVDSWFSTLPLNTWIQIYQMGYYVKTSDTTMISVPTGRG